MVDLIITNIGQLVTCAVAKLSLFSDRPKRKAQMQDVGIITDGAVAISQGKIVALGKSVELSEQYTAPEILDADYCAVCPGFVDAHTHLVFAGNRLAEFEMRLSGATYMEIMAAGGGISSTSQATRAASLAQLVDEGRKRLDTLLSLGTTSVEIKSGYGLDTITELKILEAVAQLASNHVLDIIPTFLGAHAIPKEYRSKPESYVSLVIEEMLPEVFRWAQGYPHLRPLFNDVFCEQGAFDLQQSRRILEAGLALGLPAKLHVDEFTHLQGVKLAVELGAVSVDHLDVTPAEDMQALAASDTIGVVLPAVNFNFGSAIFAPARALIDQGVALALATDVNPGSAPCYSMPLVMALACRYQHLSPAEALNASTVNAAYAIGMGPRVGSLEVGKQADILLLKVQDYRFIAYEFGVNLVHKVLKKGKVVYTNEC